MEGNITATVMDGAALAARIRSELRDTITQLASQGTSPGSARSW